MLAQRYLRSDKLSFTPSAMGSSLGTRAALLETAIGSGRSSTIGHRSSDVAMSTPLLNSNAELNCLGRYFPGLRLCRDRCNLDVDRSSHGQRPGTS